MGTTSKNKTILAILSTVGLVVSSFLVYKQLLQVIEESDEDLTDDGYF